MGAAKLNVRQEQFVQELAKGTTQRQAYLLAYPSSKKWKPETVDSWASKLANSYKISTRLEELRREIEEENKISRKKIIDELADGAFATKRPQTYTEKLKALEMLIKVLGYEKPEGVEEAAKSKDRHADIMTALREWQDAH